MRSKSKSLRAFEKASGLSSGSPFFGGPADETFFPDGFRIDETPETTVESGPRFTDIVTTVDEAVNDERLESEEERLRLRSRDALEVQSEGLDDHPVGHAAFDLASRPAPVAPHALGVGEATLLLREGRASIF